MDAVNLNDVIILITSYLALSEIPYSFDLSIGSQVRWFSGMLRVSRLSIVHSRFKNKISSAYIC